MRQSVALDHGCGPWAHLSVLDNGPAAARDYLAKHGVELVAEPHLPHTYLDGAAILGDRPVIGLTLRYDRLDNFWFTLMHELAHIALHNNDAAGAFYDDLEAAGEPDSKELEADQLAHCPHGLTAVCSPSSARPLRSQGSITSILSL